MNRLLTPAMCYDCRQALRPRWRRCRDQLMWMLQGAALAALLWTWFMAT